MRHGIWAYPPGRYWSRKGSTKVARVLDHHGWVRARRPEDADVLLVGSRRGLETVRPREGQLVDAIEGTEHLTHKGRLARLLRNGGSAEALQPETFLVDDDQGPDEGERRLLLSRARRNPAAVWIRKPQGRGRGIGVAPVVDVEAFLREHPGPQLHGPELVQRYIERPLLLEGTKSEIRSYVLIACTDPLLVLYHDGTVRLTSLPFVRDDWTNPLVHVTNTYRQRTADPDLYALRSDGLKWTLGALGRDVFARRLTEDPAWTDTTLRPGLMHIAREVVKAAVAAFVPRRGSFQLLGMDTILADDLEELWLTEIQLGPGLSVDNPVKRLLVPSMLSEALGIVLEVHSRLDAGLDPLQLRTPRWFRRVWP